MFNRTPPGNVFIFPFLLTHPRFWPFPAFKSQKPNIISLILSSHYTCYYIYYYYLFFKFYSVGNDSVTDKIKEFERDIGLTFVDSNDIDSEDSVRFVKHLDPQTTTTTNSPDLCVRNCGEGVCAFDSQGKQICRCPFGKTGSDCQISE